MMNRRKFLSFGSGLLAATGFFPSYLLASTTGTLANSLADPSAGLGKTKFDALLNHIFYIHTGKRGVMAVQLIQVKGVDGPANLEQFSLFFDGSGSPSLTTGSYEVENYLTGKLSLYLEPSHSLGDNPLYRADFSLLR